MRFPSDVKFPLLPALLDIGKQLSPSHPMGSFQRRPEHEGLLTEARA